MKTQLNFRYTFKSQAYFVLVLLMLSFFGSRAQNQTSPTVTNEFQLALKFAPYSSANDIKVQKALAESKEFKSTFTCIPAGIMIIESLKLFDAPQKEKLLALLNELNEASPYIVLEGYSLPQAEKECTNSRNSFK